MLSRGSPAVAPLNPVAVGDGWILWEEEREGTWRRPRPFLDAAPSPLLDASFSLELSAPAWAFGSVPRAILVDAGALTGMRRRG